MNSFLNKWLKIQKQEIAVFLWTAGLLFLIRTSNILLNNFAETTFLKRFGVEYLPVVYAANSIVTFVIMGMIAGVMRKMPSARLLGYLLIFCGVSVFGLRFVVGTGLDFVYPVLFLLKSQYEALLGLIFWSLANDLFNTRQSKRLFPLITAGGVLGGIIGSFGTPALADLINLNNLMVAYLVSTCMAATIVWRMNTVFPTLALPERTARKAKKKTSFKQEIKKILPMAKKSTLLKILILLTLLPNIMIPILNYQFNYAVNEAFTTEGGMLNFFGYFRGVLNIISLVILLFVGKIYSRWGLPVALMFHPANYVLAFLSFLLNFGVGSAIYARISTQVLKVTINNPARAILLGLFPSELQPLVRPFLRGTVVRVGILTGSGIILLAEGILHPKYLSIAGIICGAGWVMTSIWLKKVYSNVLLGLVSDKVVDLKSLEADDVGQLFKDKGAQVSLASACRRATGKTCVWYARMMKEQGVEDLNQTLLEIIPQKNGTTQIGLLELLTREADDQAISVFDRLYDPDKPTLNAALARTASRMPLSVSGDFLKKLYSESDDVWVKAQAMHGLYANDPDSYRPMINKWLASEECMEKCAGALAAGESGDKSYLYKLGEMLKQEKDQEVTSYIFMALNRLEAPNLQELIRTGLETEPQTVPLEVLDDYTLSDDQSVRTMVNLLGGESEELRSLAQRKLKDAPTQHVGILIESLTLPNRGIRSALFSLLENMQVSDLDIMAYARENLNRAYFNLVYAQALAKIAKNPMISLLQDHLLAKKTARVENILRVLATQEEDSSQMRIIMRGLSSANAKLRSNAVEALESMVGSYLSTAMLPLLEDHNVNECIEVAKRQFKIAMPRTGDGQVFNKLLEQNDWLIQYLILCVIAQDREISAFGFQDKIKELADSDNPRVREMATRLLDAGYKELPLKEKDMSQPITLSDKILLLKGMDIFSGLTIQELSAIASITEEERVKAGQNIVVEGEEGETMFLIISGKVAVKKQADDGRQVEIDTAMAGEYFGEMALFEDQLRSATVTAQEDTGLLVLHKREFSETVREFPQVALQICKELSRRIRNLHGTIKRLEACSQ
ncbi:Npt1/Npt2 family nucleotide transporter [Dethiosulfatarculus sandiegensis]|uniref:ADP,ATP carrier protein n=1 Tax=Dethiosulfatarculus sandiegensis TaxID=1429043 RepID=A0A0D2JV20_9BACT|nr:Npt1/Npt2 family nucleotide transporter [Dethiosulfatarculus sandiegensis]KIX13400.1 hypothetical protein X474_13890 [Dethiosulfatarculus sandiegensis]